MDIRLDLTVTDAKLLVEHVLRRAMAARASDVHVEPMARGYELRWRIDGLLHPVGTVDRTVGQSIVARLMVLAQLLTYRQDVPQEGRMALADADTQTDLRVSVIPTTHGLRAVVRLPVEGSHMLALDELNLPQPVADGLDRFAATDTGMLLLTGPAGSGKTTTIYALLEHIHHVQQGLSIIALEDPVERDLPGVTQVQIQPFGELTYDRVVRSLLRQDPQVLMMGEIRDAQTASLAVQASLTGHRLIATLHAGTPCGAITRLLEMGIEPYQVTSALSGVVAQRLVRRADGGGGYHGRIPVASFVGVCPALRQAIVDRADAGQLESIAASQPHYQTLHTAAEQLIARGLTDLAEVARVLGPRTD